MRANNSKVKIYQRGEHPQMMVLDVNKLGRPYHKIPKIFKDLHDHFDGKLSIYFLKKYRVNVTLKAMDFQMDIWQKHAQIFSSDIGNLAFDIERPLLLSVLNDYYGLNKETQENIATAETPMTRTEERLKNKLAQELVTLIAGESLFGQPLQFKPDNAALITQWSWRVNFTLEGYNGTFSLLLDNAHVDRLLTNLRQQAEACPLLNHEQPQVNLQRSFMTLPVRLTGRLATLPMTVADLLQLQSGDILPVTLGDRTPLFIGQQPLFSAMIASDRGKLFFAEFIDPSREKNDD